jgi:hypothetical protein
MVRRASSFLAARSSRRGFLVGAAVTGSAVAASGVKFATQPGSAYAAITDCPPTSLCNDGYTEFCCTINNGINACPPGTFVAGWWRADYSSFCNGTRYYMDCNESCCGPNLGNGFCAGCHEARCAGDCNTRRVYANYFRYGQCHQEIGILGPIACRLVTCTPPYTVAEYACTTALAVDNSTAEHAPAKGCAPPAPPIIPVVTGTATSPAAGQVAVFYRGGTGNVFGFLSNGGAFDGGQLGPGVNSGLTAAADATGLYVFGRGAYDAIWWNRRSGNAWSGPQAFPGIPVTSDPTAVTAPDAIYLFARSQNNQLWHGHIDNGVWSDWFPMQGNLTSDVAAVSSAYGVHVFARQNDGQLWTRLLSGGAWSPWTALGGSPKATPTAVATPSGVYVFIRNSDGAIWFRRFTGGWGGWQNLGGQWTGVPSSAVDGAGSVYVLARGTNGNVFSNRSISGSWTGWQNLAGSTNASPIVVSATNYVSVFVRGTDDALWHGRYTSSGWTGLSSLGGNVAAQDVLIA